MFEHDYVAFPELTNSQLSEMGFSSPHKQIEEDFVATVVKVHDGDTITLRCSFRDFDFPMRFADIDAPELNAGGEEAREWLKNLLLNQVVEIKIDPAKRTEKYGRLLGRVFYLGLDVGQQEVYLGYVFEYGRKLEGQVPVEDKIFSMKQWLTY